MAEIKITQHFLGFRPFALIEYDEGAGELDGTVGGCEDIDTQIGLLLASKKVIRALLKKARAERRASKKAAPAAILGEVE